MSMRLTRDDLSNIMLTLDALAEVPADVKQVRVGSHEVFLDRAVDKSPGSKTSYIIRGITDKLDGAPVTRGGR